MKYKSEYYAKERIEPLVARIKALNSKPCTIMEVCGGQTNTIVRYALEDLLPSQVKLVHGPGCPVCVTPVNIIDAAIAIALQPQVIFCSFGDMLRVPGSEQSLADARAKGAEVQIVYSPLEAVTIAQKNPDKEVIFFAVGFETTVPANALAVLQAKEKKLTNFSVLVSQVAVPPALKALLAAPCNKIQGFLAAGHVCTIMGLNEYYPIAKKHKVPIVITGFDPLDILQGVYLCLQQLQQSKYEVVNQYSRVVKPEGNLAAKKVIMEVFQIATRPWRGLGEIPDGGLVLRPEYADYDATLRFANEISGAKKPSIAVKQGCMSGEVLRGNIKPIACPLFATSCTPLTPYGAPMVSEEGACSAYYRYRKSEVAIESN